MNNKEYKSHYCCWEQNKPPECGIAVDKHTQCCLCEKEVQEFTEEDFIKAEDFISPPLQEDSWEKEFDKKIWKHWSDDSFNFLGPYKLQKKGQIKDFIRQEKEKSHKEGFDKACILSQQFPLSSK